MREKCGGGRVGKVWWEGRWKRWGCGNGGRKGEGGGREGEGGGEGGKGKGEREGWGNSMPHPHSPISQNYPTPALPNEKWNAHPPHTHHLGREVEEPGGVKGDSPHPTNQLPCICLNVSSCPTQGNQECTHPPYPLMHPPPKSAQPPTKWQCAKNASLLQPHGRKALSKWKGKEGVEGRHGGGNAEGVYPPSVHAPNVPCPHTAHPPPAPAPSNPGRGREGGRGWWGGKKVEWAAPHPASLGARETRSDSCPSEIWRRQAVMLR